MGTYNSYTGKTQLADCFECPIGKHADEEGLSLCKDCEQGTYQDTTKQSICKSCPPGTYSTATGNTKEENCLPCDEGSFSVGRQPTCTLCFLGKYQNEKGKSDCIKCPVGTYQDVRGMISCKKCAAGKYNPAEESQSESSCLQCDKGYFSGEGQEYCTKCYKGQFQDQIGQSTCKYLIFSNNIHF